MSVPQANVPKVSLFGISISRLGMQQTVQYITEAIETRRVQQVVTANPIMLMMALDNPAYMAMMKRAELVIADGTGVVWAAKHVGSPVTERVAGYDLLQELMRVGEDYGWRVFLLGASPEVIRNAATILGEQYPKTTIVGYHDGYFDASRDQEIIAKIQQAKPHILFVGRSTDRQEPWIDQYKQQLQVPLMMGVGGSFDGITGVVKRAPLAWQKLRMEWLYRLLREPSRAPRMLALPRFVLRVILAK